MLFHYIQYTWYKTVPIYEYNKFEPNARRKFKEEAQKEKNKVQ